VRQPPAARPCRIEFPLSNTTRLPLPPMDALGASYLKVGVTNAAPDPRNPS
jgi:hypothetical protein